MTEPLAEEVERRKRELASTLGLLYQESERRAKAEAEVEYWKGRAEIAQEIAVDLGRRLSEEAHNQPIPPSVDEN